MIIISNRVSISLAEVEISAIRAMGSGGQNVNKVSSAVHLRFNIQTSSLPELYKENLLAMRDSRITKEGIIIIKAQSYRTQEQNRADALLRLEELVKRAGVQVKKRQQTKPTRSSVKKRLDKKSQRSQVKSMRKSISY
jgi:ribosome-associated protein